MNYCLLIYLSAKRFRDIGKRHLALFMVMVPILWYIFYIWLAIERSADEDEDDD